MLDSLWRMLIAPRSKDKDRSRREFILNILLIGLIALSSTAFLINVVNLLIYNRQHGESPVTAGLISVFFVLLFILSRKGKSSIAATLLILLLLLVATYLNFQWGADLQFNLLLFALTIVMAGILIGTRFAFLVTWYSVVSILFFTVLELRELIHPNRIRAVENIRMADSIVHVILLAIIATVSWLFNRESEKALRRARASEAALKKQRDTLELLVEERTKDLKQAQAEKIAQIYRFAEFGRSASGFFHDLVTPLTLTSINLDSLAKHINQPEVADAKIALNRAIIGTKRLESFIKAARRQVQDEKIFELFSIKDEICQSVQVLGYKAKVESVKIETDIQENINMFGNAVKFNQIVTNLLSNAIDSYDNVKKNNKVVKISCRKIHRNVSLVVQDWGCGIEKNVLPNIFDPLFTTKKNKGTGIGLSICKDIIEKDFKGSCKVVSNRNEGTTFTVEFPIKDNVKK